MADDFFDEDDGATPPASGAVNPAALDAALNGPAATTDEARAFLREQEKLTKLQAKILREEQAFELSHYRWRRFNDRMKGALQIMAVTIVAAVVVAIGAAIWSASRADGLVIDSFSAPPSYVQSGVSGEVVATDITEKLSAIRRFILAYSLTDTKSISAEGRDDVRVEIPETGVSFAQAWRYLKSWLGHERHMSGSLREMGGGNVAIVANLSGAPSVSETGSARDLDRLEARLAEKIFVEIDPLNMTVYYFDTGRTQESVAPSWINVRNSMTPEARAGAYTLVSATTALAKGDFALALAQARLPVEIDPDLAVGYLQLADVYQFLGRDEDELHTLEAAGHTVLSRQTVTNPRAFAYIQSHSMERIAELEGDFRAAIGVDCFLDCPASTLLWSRAQNLARLHDVAGSRHAFIDATASAHDDGDSARDVPSMLEDISRFYFAAEVGDWRRAEANAQAAEKVHEAANGDRSARWLAVTATTHYARRIALAAAHLHEFAEARRLIDRTPGDCTECLSTRGEIARLEGRADAAAFWYARAIALAPDIPFAYADWGAMMLRDGKYDAAIAKFRAANLKGPHFADPLEMWGEALMQENRSDLALTKFEEAAKDAPNWGRLHLAWGKALYYAGRQDESKKQIAIAANLDLSPSDKASLDNWTKTHG